MFDDTEKNPFLRATSDGTLLTIVLHTASFEDAIVNRDEMTTRLLKLATLSRVRLICTPTEDERVRESVRRVRGEVGEYEADDEWLLITTPIPAEARYRVRHIGDWRAPAEPGSRVTVLDELFTNSRNVDLFIVADGDPFLRRDRRRRWYVCPRDALDLVRVLVTSLHHEDSFYYKYRASKLFPAADLARVAMNIASDHGFPPELRDHIVSFRQRIELILRAADRIAYHALRRPDGRAAGKCAYHLAYFFTLVTGLFDEVAWTIAHYHNLSLKRNEIVLRPGRGALQKHLLHVNPDLAQFLADPDTKATIELFYPARDQIQHRTLLPAWIEARERPQRVVAALPEATLQNAVALSTDGGVSWGILNGSSAGEVDPYVFTMAAVEAVAKVANGILSRLDWKRYADLLPQEEREQKRGFFDSETGTGKMDRFHPIPPYF